MKREQTKRIINLGIIVWLFVILVAYFVYHKPATSEIIKRLITTLYQVFIVFVMVCISGGVGRWLFSRLSLPKDTNPSIQAALGFGILSILFLIIGSTIGVNALLSALLVLFFVFFFFRDIRAWIQSWRNQSPTVENLSKIKIAMIAIMIVMAMGTLLVALAPPLKFDALVYHLALPDAYIKEGRVTYHSGNIFWGMPQLTEMLYTWVMSLGGAQSAAVLGWCFAMITLWGLYSHMKDHMSSESAWIAVAALMGGYTLAASFSWAYVGWLSMLFGWGVLYLLDVFNQGAGKQAVYMAGIFAGLGFGVKYTAGLLGVASAIYLVYCIRKGKLEWGDLVRFGFAWIAVSLPWLLKNVLATGNPIYPLMFPSGAMDSIRLNLYQGNPTWGDWRDVVLLPLRATLVGVEGAPGYSASIGPLLLSFSLISLYGYKTRSLELRKLLGVAACFVFTFLLIWVIGARFSGLLIQTRLYLSVFPCVAVLAAIGFDALRDLRFGCISIRLIALIIVLFVISVNALQIIVDVAQTSAIKYLVTTSTQEEYLQQNLGWFYPAMTVMRELTAEANVLMLWEPRSFYCPVECQPDEILDRWQHDSRTYDTPEDILREWRILGYTHLLVNKSGMEFIRANDARYSELSWKSLDDLLDQTDLVVNFADVYTLYRLNQ